MMTESSSKLKNNINQDVGDEGSDHRQVYQALYLLSMMLERDTPEEGMDRESSGRLVLI